MYVEKVFEIPPLQLQKRYGLRPGYLYYVGDSADSIEGVGKTPQAAILDLRRNRRRLRTRSYEYLSHASRDEPSWR